MHAVAVRRLALRGVLLRSVFAVVIAGTVWPGLAIAAKKKPVKKAEPTAPAAPAPVDPVVSTPAAPPPAAPTAPSAPPPQWTPPPAAEPAVPTPAYKPTTRTELLPTEEPERRPTRQKRRKAAWEGFFLEFNIGYANAGGEDGPAIAEPENVIMVPSLALTRELNRKDYDKAITTNRGAGVALALQIGYNIAGYASLWADLSWHGSFGAKADMAGAGTAAAMLGLHPLRFWRDDLPADVRLYAGYGFFDLLYYYETQFQQEATGKAWLGTAIPFGLSAEYRLDDEGVFTMGADLRMVQASYTKWVYNNDKDQASKLDPPVTTFRIEPRAVFGWHF